MRAFASVFGFVNLCAGVFLVAFPHPARRLIEMRAEIAKLSDDGLRFLGGWVILLGATIVWMAQDSKTAAKIGEAVGAEWRRAA